MKLHYKLNGNLSLNMITSNEYEITDIKDINAILLGNHNTKVKQNLALDDVFQLGWNSIIEVINTQNTFIFQKVNLSIYSKNAFVDSGESFPSGTFSQIVTRGVHSCTFLHIAGHNARHLIAHLDYQSLSAAMDIITTFINNNGCNYVEISAINDTEENKLVKSLSSKVASDKFVWLCRGDVSGVLLSHVEIGVEANGGCGNLFGDIVESDNAMSSNKSNDRQLPKLPTLRIFNNAKDFIKF